MFDDSSSCKKTNVSTQKHKPSLTETHSADVSLLLYLTEKVGQDLLCEGGCHRAELEREKSEGCSSFSHLNMINKDIIDRTVGSFHIHHENWVDGELPSGLTPL